MGIPNAPEHFLSIKNLCFVLNRKHYLLPTHCVLIEAYSYQLSPN